jgi:hypothetical protein
MSSLCSYNCRINGTTVTVQSECDRDPSEVCGAAKRFLEAERVVPVPGSVLTMTANGFTIAPPRARTRSASADAAGCGCASEDGEECQCWKKKAMAVVGAIVIIGLIAWGISKL